MRLSREVIALSKLPWFLAMMKELGYDPVKHGHWIKTDYEDTYECSVCGEMWTLNDGTPKENNMDYCMRCGAKMDEVEE